MLERNELKRKAINLRKNGKSYRDISKELGVARSTLSGWLKDVPLSSSQRMRLHEKWVAGLFHARKLAAKYHKDTRIKSIKSAGDEAKEFMNSMALTDETLELFLAGLYLGDGFKINGRLGLGNANPKIVLLFLTLIRKLYAISELRLHAAIYARADQNQDELLAYWSNLLNIPKTQFHKTQFDGRTKDSSTIPGYHGVCAVVYCDCSLQRRILAIGDEMLKYR